MCFFVCLFIVQFFFSVSFFVCLFYLLLNSFCCFFFRMFILFIAQFFFFCYFRLKIKGQRLLIWWRFHPFLTSVSQSFSFITSFLSVFLPYLTLFLSFLPSFLCLCAQWVFKVTKQKFFKLRQHHCKSKKQTFQSIYLSLLIYCCFLIESLYKRHRAIIQPFV